MTTAAAIDRLVHHSVVLELNVPSYRDEQARKRKKINVKKSAPLPIGGPPRGAYAIRRMLPKNGKNNCRQREFIIDVSQLSHFESMQAVTYTPEAMTKLKEFESRNGELEEFGVCMVKTHLSLSHDSNLKGRPRNWTLPIRDILLYKGAGLIVPLAGDIKLMPGTSSNPAFRHIDVDVETGKVRGLF